MTLPPGQRRIEGFPRFGTHFGQRPPVVPADPAIEVAGAVVEPFAVRVDELATLPRRALTADFHCVAGWTATDVHWEGVELQTFYRERVEPAVAPGPPITHLSFAGLDGYRSIVQIEDALTDDVLLADRLDGQPLDDDHGAPVRLVSPAQYGFISTKHLCRIELHTTEPTGRYHPSLFIDRGLRLVKPHRRARVQEEERHRYLPAWAVRGVYGLLIGPIKGLARRR